MEVVAPYFGDPPPPGGQPGMPYPGLWDYEVLQSIQLQYVVHQSVCLNYCIP